MPRWDAAPATLAVAGPTPPAVRVVHAVGADHVVDRDVHGGRGGPGGDRLPDVARRRHVRRLGDGAARHRGPGPDRHQGAPAGRRRAEIAVTRTAADGTYRFPAVPSTAYVVEVLAPSGAEVVGAAVMSADATLGDVVGVDFLVRR